MIQRFGGKARSKSPVDQAVVAFGETQQGPFREQLSPA